MVFVDGENLTYRAQAIAKEKREDLTDTSRYPLFKQDVYFWPSGDKAHNRLWSPTGYLNPVAERCYYYASAKGAQNILDKARDELQAFGFSPTVFKKYNDKSAKGVDIALTKDMLVNAFFGNFHTAVLVAGDADYVPLVEEVKRFGRRVIVAFFEGKKSGLSSELRRAADEFHVLKLY
jgi:uncharacterized LabA/DUF88 family protein